MPMVWLTYLVMCWRGDPCSQVLPSFHWVLLEVALCGLLEEVPVLLLTTGQIARNLLSTYASHRSDTTYFPLHLLLTQVRYYVLTIHTTHTGQILRTYYTVTAHTGQIVRTLLYCHPGARHTGQSTYVLTPYYSHRSPDTTYLLYAALLLSQVSRYYVLTIPVTTHTGSDITYLLCTYMYI